MLMGLFTKVLLQVTSLAVDTMARTPPRARLRRLLARDTGCLPRKVGIRQDEQFNLVKRLLVPGGGHIKRIAMATGAKLTVRAEGSANMEGPLMEEITDEPLMICIRTAYASSLDKAIVAVEDLIWQIHEDYRAFCWNRNLPEPELSVPPGEMSSW